MAAAWQIFFTCETPSMNGMTRRRAKSHSSWKENCGLLTLGSTSWDDDTADESLHDDDDDDDDPVSDAWRVGLHMDMMPASASTVKLMDSTGTGT